MNQSVTIRQGFTEEQRTLAAEVIYGGFERKLLPVLGDRAQAIALLAAGLRPAVTLVAADGEKVVGVAGLKYGGVGFMQPRLSDFVRIYGPLMAPVRLILFSAMESPVPRDQLLLDMLAVSARVRGQGIGTRLLRATFDFARDHGYGKVRLDVVDTNPDAYRLYERMGFEPVRVQQFPIVGPWMGFRSATIMVHTLE